MVLLNAHSLDISGRIRDSLIWVGPPKSMGLTAELAVQLSCQLAIEPRTTRRALFYDADWKSRKPSFVCLP